MGSIKRLCKGCGKRIELVGTMSQSDRVQEDYCNDCGPKGRRETEFDENGKPYQVIKQNTQK